LVDSQLKKPQDPKSLFTLYYLRSLADTGLRDKASLQRDITQTLKHGDDSAMLRLVHLSMGMQIDPDLALTSFEALAKLSPDIARGLDEGMVWRLSQFFRQNHRTAQYERLVLALADISYGSVRSSDNALREAAEILVTRGDVGRALVHARKIRSRDGLIDILTDRRFERLWPELERSSGDRLEIPARAQLQKAQAAFESDPTSLTARLDLMRAFTDLGDLTEADQLGAAVGNSLEDLMGLDETTAYVIDEHAELLAVLGRADEADRRRAALLPTWTGDRRWVINMAINRLAALLDAGQFKKVLEELDRPGNRYQQDSSAYAKQLLRVLRIGSLFGLGRRTEGLTLVPELIAHSSDAPGATIDGLLLAGRDDDAERLALEYLRKPDSRNSIIRGLRFADRAPKLDGGLADKMHARLRARASVEAAFQSYARDLPERFVRTY
jgi:hypothetical protein